MRLCTTTSNRLLDDRRLLLVFLTTWSMGLAIDPSGLNQILPEERMDPDTYDPEAAMTARAKHVLGECWKLSSPNSPESAFLSSINAKNESENLAIFQQTHPRFEVCSPTSGWLDPWISLRDQFDEQIDSGHHNRLRVIAVTHPLSRLARSFLEHFRRGQGQHFDIIRRVYAGASGSQELSFKNFVDFLTRGADRFSSLHPEILTDWTFNRYWSHYYDSCHVCSHDTNTPTFVIKSDVSPNLFSKDIEALQEIFGLEETEFPFEDLKEIPEETLKSLYSEISGEDLSNLVQLYHMDFSMYLYSSEKFYEYVNDSP